MLSSIGVKGLISLSRVVDRVLPPSCELRECRRAVVVCCVVVWSEKLICLLLGILRISVKMQY